MGTSNQLPAAPDLVLRLGFAGNRDLPAGPMPLVSALDQMLDVAAARLLEIGSGLPGETDVPRIAHYYSKNPPTLRMINGLAEGADDLACQALLSRSENKQLRHELAAVLPFDAETYRDSRNANFRQRFEELHGTCAYVVELDGRYVAGPAGKRFRSRAYRAQAMMLLRHADIVVVAANPDAEGQAGGALETVRAAIAFDLPVLFIHTVTGEVRTIEPGQDAVDAMDAVATCAGPEDWKEVLRRWITKTVADPDVVAEATNSHAGHSSASTDCSVGERLLQEYFTDRDAPPILDGERDREWRERLWEYLELRFRSLPAPPADAPLPQYVPWRKRATNLNYHYTGLYRGAYVANYLLAVGAVLMAALSLTILAVTKGHAPEGVLLALGLIKLFLVISIFFNTKRANEEGWNGKAIDYRYLAERLRMQFYLPRAGSFQPPAAAPPQYASARIRQSAVDWLFDAIVRSVSPAEFANARVKLSPGKEIPTLKPDPPMILKGIKEHWLDGQIAYHERTSDTMNRFNEQTELFTKVLNATVIGTVVVDILVVLAVLFELVSHEWAEDLHAATPWLIFIAAVLPAAVASLNGIRFQSECGRLADRSFIVKRLLEAHRQEADELMHCMEAHKQNATTDPGSWSAPVLNLAERCARDMVEEVADWSALYGKEVPET